MADKRISTKVRKRMMLDALKASFGVVKPAAEQAGVNRATHYLWLEKDPAYKKAFLELEEIKKDFVEHKLIALINDKDTAATIFAAKSLLQDRGYVQRQELTGKGGGPIKGDITHTVQFKNSKQADEDKEGTEE